LRTGRGAVWPLCGVALLAVAWRTGRGWGALPPPPGDPLDGCADGVVAVAGPRPGSGAGAAVRVGCRGAVGRALAASECGAAAAGVGTLGDDEALVFAAEGAATSAAADEGEGACDGPFAIRPLDGAPRLALGRAVDLNGASAADLEALPRIGPALAARIVADRVRRGRFPDVDALVRVRGIGPKLLARLRPYLAVAPPALDGVAEDTGGTNAAESPNDSSSSPAR
jgi:competence protein ComEA